MRTLRITCVTESRLKARGARGIAPRWPTASRRIEAMNVITPPDGGRAALLHDCSDAEWDLRVTLAAAFRLGYHLNWNRVISHHISARLQNRPDLFMMNHYGPRWIDITPSLLVNADGRGQLQIPGRW